MMKRQEINTNYKNRVNVVGIQHMKSGFREKTQDDNTIHQIQHNELVKIHSAILEKSPVKK